MHFSKQKLSYVNCDIAGRAVNLQGGGGGFLIHFLELTRQKTIATSRSIDFPFVSSYESY